MPRATDAKISLMADSSSPVGSVQYVSSAEIHFKKNTKVLNPSDWKLKLFIIYIFKKIQ
jgi:hypothetical protein